MGAAMLLQSQRAVLALLGSLQVAACMICGPYESTTLTKNDVTVVCFEYKDNSTASSATAYTKFHPKLDNFAMFDLDETLSGTFWNNASTSSAQVRAVVGDKTTDWVSILDISTPSQAAFYTLMISVKNGKLQSINWDKDCVCDICYEKQCREQCPSTGCNPSVKVYTVWTGTDSDNTVMLSAANRYSELNKYSTSKMFGSMSGSTSGYCQDNSCNIMGRRVSSGAKGRAHNPSPPSYTSEWLRSTTWADMADMARSALDRLSQ